jgi:SAM-dependent methyltransferase
MSHNIIEIIDQNEKAWDAIADLFLDASALPVWGPFGVGDDLNLIPKIEGKVFLEVGCGSGRSIKYLIENGARKVYGLDLSREQLDEAKKCNAVAHQEGRVVLLKGAMEYEFLIKEPVDVVFSVYAIGWTQSPRRTFYNIFSYLKPGGLFVWSWDHTFFTNVQHKDGEHVVEYSYHDESLITIQKWMGRDVEAHITYRKTSTWFRFLREAGFEIIGYHEPRPKNIDRGSDDPKKHYSIQKAEKVPATMIFVCWKP